LALLYYYKDDYDRAEDLLTSFLSQNSDDYELHFYLGLVFVARKQYELAEMEIEKALALRPDFVQAWQNLCYLAIRQEQWAKALDRARRFVAAVEDNADAWRTLGYVQGMQKKLPRALSSLKRAVALDSTDAQAWFELGSVLERMERYDAAADAFRRVLRLNPDDHAAANYLGYMWAEQGVKLDSARTLLEFALDKDPENGAYLDSYAWIFYKKGDYANAHIYLLKALLHIDDDPVIYAHLGDVMAARGNIDDAVKAYRRSIELGSEEREHLESRIEDLLNRKDGSFADSPESP
jgi:tetratricopeptide (TPR) repeat protein